MKYDILKESLPLNTVTRIKDILNSLDIRIIEKITKNFNSDIKTPCSLRICIENLEHIGTNGKGNSPENAKASAYAEFMERLQNNMLFPMKSDNFVFAPDEKYIDIENYKDNVLKKYIDSKRFKYLNEYVNYSNLNLSDGRKILVVPFYDISSKKTVFLPIFAIRLLQSSNGMAAGNTLEEALVQGLSEICERYALRRVILEKISLPEIPKSEYIKYDKICQIIKNIENNGFSIYIKDASIGLSIPVVCAIIKDTKKNILSVNFGAHPSLPVAIERCLTEFAQNFDFTDAGTNSDLRKYISKETIESFIKNNNIQFMAEELAYRTCCVQNCEYIEEMFFADAPAYPYCRNSWIKNSGKTDNRILLKFLIKNIKKSSCNIFVRDVSYVGFPSVDIVIPEMSFIFNYDTLRIKNMLEIDKWLNDGMKDRNYTIEKLFNSLYFRESIIPIGKNKVTESQVMIILLLCAVILDKKEAVIQFSNRLLEKEEHRNNIKAELLTKIKIIKTFFDYKSKNINDIEIYDKLYKMYDKEAVDNFKIFIKYLSFDVIKLMIKEYTKKKNISDKYNEIKSTLSSMYEKNIINQKNLERIIFE